MFIYKENYKQIHDFTLKLLVGGYDRSIYDNLYGLSKSMNSQRFIALAPTDYFKFVIELANREEPFIIDSWAMKHCYRWHASSSSLERKLIMLASSIIQSQHTEISAILMLNKDEKLNHQTQQTNNKETKNV